MIIDLQIVKIVKLELKGTLMRGNLQNIFFMLKKENQCTMKDLGQKGGNLHIISHIVIIYFFKL